MSEASGAEDRTVENQNNVLLLRDLTEFLALNGNVELQPRTLCQRSSTQMNRYDNLLKDMFELISVVPEASSS